MQRTQVIIVRHGQTEWNIRGIRQGHLDSELTEKGIVQAKALAQRLARESFAALYCSDLSRAREFDYGTPVYVRGMTAAELRRALKLP